MLQLLFEFEKTADCFRQSVISYSFRYLIQLSEAESRMPVADKQLGVLSYIILIKK